VHTATLIARFEQGALVEVRRRRDGCRLLEAPADALSPLELVYAGQEAVPLRGEPGDTVTCLPIDDHCAEVRFSGWNGDGLLVVSEDRQTGDLVVEPSGCASRPGLRACRWNVGRCAAGLELVAPFFQGVRLPLSDELIGGAHWQWPHQWEAGLAILQGQDGGLWVHCRDDRYRYKALQVGADGRAGCLGLETEAPGPLHDNLAAGGLAWRLNVFDGDWQTPAAAYRDWLEATWDLRPRPEWVSGLRLAVSWCPTDPGLLAALSARLAPPAVLLHVPGWRTDAYDENYPTYQASEAGRAFIARARQLGFRVMPHFNSIDMDPTHPVYAHVRDFQYRDLESRRVQGWTWVDGRVRPVPESNAARLRHRDRKTMVKIHPGSSLWRSFLAESVRRAAVDLSLELAFLDVTLCTWNLHNCLVEGVTPTEGMKRLTAHVARLGGGLVVGGEGRNEVTMQEQGVAQVHLFRSWHQSAPGLERTGGCPLNEFLFGRWCPSFGYSGLGGSTPEEAARMRTHVSLGAMPTVTVRGAADIERPNAAVAQMLSLASR
jgi:hypothetical protein